MRRPFKIIQTRKNYTLRQANAAGRIPLDGFDIRDYSLRRATTGSFFAAARAGIKPLISVNKILIQIMMNAEPNGNAANVAIPVNVPSKALIANDSR
jgi:hypothetical protein